MRLPSDYAAPKQEQEAVEYIWERKGCVQQRREPIVRCRDCKYKDEPWNCAAPYYVEQNGFCAWGERRGE